MWYIHLKAYNSNHSRYCNSIFIRTIMFHNTVTTMLGLAKFLTIRERRRFESISTSWEFIPKYYTSWGTLPNLFHNFWSYQTGDLKITKHTQIWNIWTSPQHCCRWPVGPAGQTTPHVSDTEAEQRRCATVAQPRLNGGEFAVGELWPRHCRAA